MEKENLIIFDKERFLNVYGLDNTMHHGGYGMGYGGWTLPLGFPIPVLTGIGITPNLFLFKSHGLF